MVALSFKGYCRRRRSPRPHRPAAAALAAAYWGKQLDCNVTFISPKTVLFPVEMDGKYVKVISGEGVGWIIVYDWVDEYFEEIKE